MASQTKIKIESSVIRIDIKNFSDIVTIMATLDGKQWAASHLLTKDYSNEEFGDLLMLLGKTIKENKKVV